MNPAAANIPVLGCVATVYMAVDETGETAVQVMSTSKDTRA